MSCRHHEIPHYVIHSSPDTLHLHWSGQLHILGDLPGIVGQSI